MFASSPELFPALAVLRQGCDGLAVLNRERHGQTRSFQRAGPEGEGRGLGNGIYGCGDQHSGFPMSSKSSFNMSFQDLTPSPSQVSAMEEVCRNH